jgi:hypothetical protein
MQWPIMAHVLQTIENENIGLKTYKALLAMSLYILGIPLIAHIGM